MKHKFLSLLTSGVAIFTLCACAETEKGKDITPVIPKEGTYEEFDFRGQDYDGKDYFAVKKHLYNLKVGDTAQIQVDSLPTNFALNSIEFESKNTGVVTVSETGKITAVKNGIGDVIVRSKDGDLSYTVRVVVSTLSSAEGCKTALDNIGAIYNAEDHEPAKRVIRYEYSKEMYLHEGVLDHGFEGYEVLAYDATAGYLYIEGPSLYYKTTGGTPELLDGKWIMYPINSGVMTRLVHVTPTKKNYFDINTAAYEGDYHAIMKDIVNFFFVSGEKIINDLLADYEGAEDFNDFQEYSSTKFYSVDDNSVLFTYHQERDDTVSADDEINYIDVPAETPYHEVMDLELINSNAKSIGYNINASMIYKLGEENWERVFVRSQLFGDDFKVEKIQNPKDNGYTLVDSLYDL